MNSIKESFDNLPVAVCLFDKRGVVRLMNRRMLSVGAELLGSGVQTLEELHRALDTPPESIERLDAEMPALMVVGLGMTLLLITALLVMVLARKTRTVTSRELLTE